MLNCSVIKSGSLKNSISESFPSVVRNMSSDLVRKETPQNEKTYPGIFTSDFIIFNNDGTIAQKSYAGNYQDYWTNHADAVRNIYNPVNTISQDQQNITYTPFNKIKSISEVDFSLSIKYGPDQQRRNAELRNQGSLVSTKFYFPGYEKEISGSNSREVYYINAPTGLCALYVVENGTATMYYVYKDHLGSILKVADGNGNTSEQSFDAWGRYRNPDDWTYSNVPSRPQWLYRGYTGHEHLPQFSLINMNGRVYDPVLGMMLSPDNFVADATNALAFNRYSYCFNNPLSYIDADGNNPLVIAALALLGAYLGGSVANGGELNPGKWDFKDPSTYFAIVIGAAVGAVGGSALVGTGSVTLGIGAGVPGLAVYYGGSSNNWNFSWTTSAGGGGSIGGNSGGPSIDMSNINSAREFVRNQTYDEFNTGPSFDESSPMFASIIGEIQGIGRGILFSNENKAYRYLWNNSVADKIEYHGFLTNKGVLALPTNDNDATSSNFWINPTRKNNGNWQVQYNHEWLNIMGSVHTHLRGENPYGSDFYLPTLGMGPSFIIGPYSVMVGYVNNGRDFSSYVMTNKQLLYGGWSLYIQLSKIPK